MKGKLSFSYLNELIMNVNLEIFYISRRSRDI